MAPRNVLLLPGMMLDRRMYNGQLPGLAGAARVEVAELWHDDTIAAMAGRALAGAPDRFALVGLSMGGIVALEMWRRAADRITHLALLDTTPHADTPERRALRLEQIARVEAGGLRDVVVSSLKPLYLARRHREDPRLLQSIVEQALTLGPEAFRRQSLALRDRADSVSTLPTVGCPSLVLCGREDQLCPVEDHTMMAAEMPCADLVVLAGCGHLSAMEDPEAVKAALVRLLSRDA